MRVPACVLVIITVASAVPQPTPPPLSTSTITHEYPASTLKNCIEVDISEIEELRAKLENTIAFDLIENIENISFGLLNDDWKRLKLLQARLPDNSALKKKLVKLFRLLIAALYQAHQNSGKPVQDEVDNEAAESEQQASVLPPLLNSASTYENEAIKNLITISEIFCRPTMLPDVHQSNKSDEENGKTMNPGNIKSTPNLNEEVKYNTTLLQLLKEKLPTNLSADFEDINSEYTTKNTEKSYKVFTIDDHDTYTDYDNQHVNVLPVNTKDDVPAVKFVEEFDNTFEPSTETYNISVDGPKTESAPIINVSKSSRGTTTFEKTTFPSTSETENSKAMGFGGTLNDKITTIDGSTETQYLFSDKSTPTLETPTSRKNKSIDANQSLYNRQSTVSTTPLQKNTAPEQSYGVILDKDNIDQVLPLTSTSFAPYDNENTIEGSENEHGKLYESKSGASQNVTTIGLSTVNTLPTEQSIGTSLNKRSTTLQPPESYHFKDNNNTIRSTDHTRIDQYPISTESTFHSSHFNNNNEIDTATTGVVDLSTSSMSNKTLTDHNSFHSTNLIPFNTSRAMEISQNKTVNETFSSFTYVFPERPKHTSSTTGVNKLTIYTADQKNTMYFPFQETIKSPFVQTGCQSKKACVKVKNIKFYYPQNSRRYTTPNNDIISEDTNPKSNKKDFDSESALWLNKMRTLRKKHVEE